MSNTNPDKDLQERMNSLPQGAKDNIMSFLPQDVIEAVFKDVDIGRRVLGKLSASSKDVPKDAYDWYIGSLIFVRIVISSCMKTFASPESADEIGINLLWSKRNRIKHVCNYKRTREAHEFEFTLFYVPPGPKAMMWDEDMNLNNKFTLSVDDSSHVDILDIKEHLQELAKRVTPSFTNDFLYQELWAMTDWDVVVYSKKKQIKYPELEEHLKQHLNRIQGYIDGFKRQQSRIENSVLNKFKEMRVNNSHNGGGQCFSREKRGTYPVNDIAVAVLPVTNNNAQGGSRKSKELKQKPVLLEKRTIDGRARNVYKKGKKLYIKVKGEFVGLTEYKKQTRK